MGTRVRAAPAQRCAARLLAMAALSAGPVSAFAVVDCEQAGPTMEAVRRCVLDLQQQQVDSVYRSLASCANATPTLPPNSRNRRRVGPPLPAIRVTT